MTREQENTQGKYEQGSFSSTRDGQKISSKLSVLACHHTRCSNFPAQFSLVVPTI